MLMGGYEKQLDLALTVLNVVRQAYHSKVMVGNHCQKVLNRFEVLTKVIGEDSLEDRFNESFSTFSQAMKLIMVRRFLSADEIEKLCSLCNKFGTSFPINFPDRNIILSSPYREVGDEVFIEVNQNNLVTMGKESQYAKDHVLAGITKCSKKLLEKMNNFYKTQKTKEVDYDDCLIVCRHENFTVLNNPDITIMEIDDAEHLTLAKTVLPTIIHNSTVQHHEKF